MKLPFSLFARRPLVAGVGVVAVAAMLIGSYGIYRWDRARSQLIRVEAVALQTQQGQQGQSARIGVLEKTVQQIVAQVTASGDNTQKTFAQIVATTTQLTAAVNANGESATARIDQLQATIDQLRAALAAGGANVAPIAKPTAPVVAPAAPVVPQPVLPQPERKSALPAPVQLAAVTAARPGAVTASVACSVTPLLSGASPRPALADLQSASLRLLPFPFQHYFTIASDADSMTIDAAQAIKQTLAADLRLNFSDSTFVDPYYVGNGANRPILPTSVAQL